MRVLQIVSGYHKQHLYDELFSGLKKQGIENYIFSQINRGEIVQNKYLNQANLVFSKGYSRIERFSFFLKQNDMLKHIQDAFSVSEMDMIHAHTLFSSGFSALRLKQKYDIPYMVTIRGADINYFFKYCIPLRRLGLRILNEASKVVFLSETFKEIVLSRYVPTISQQMIEKKSSVIPNGISDYFFDNIGKPRELKSKKDIRLIVVANINENKNLDGIVRVCRILKSEGVNTRLTVVGAIREKRYEQFVLDNSDIIEYHNKAPQNEVIRYLQESDVFIMPSHSETFGLVYAEAMSQGLPVIYTAKQGFDKQFNDGLVGFPVNDRDNYTIVEAVKKVIDNYSSISANCIKLVSKFNWTDVSKAYSDLYKSCIHTA